LDDLSGSKQQCNSDRYKRYRARKKAREAELPVEEQEHLSKQAKSNARKRQQVKRSLQKSSRGAEHVTFVAASVEDRQGFGGILCKNWCKASLMLGKWNSYCKEFFDENESMCKLWQGCVWRQALHAFR
jgi:hypothetical protein